MRFPVGFLGLYFFLVRKKGGGWIETPLEISCDTDIVLLLFLLGRMLNVDSFFLSPQIAIAKRGLITSKSRGGVVFSDFGAVGVPG